MKTIKKITLVCIAIVSISTLNAQEEEKAKASFDIGVDFASRYVWRGQELGGNSTAIQPYIEFASGRFTLGAWASYTTSGQDGQEFDIYAGYSFGAISVGFIDYQFPIDGLGNTDKYFNIDTHVGEVSLSFEGVESFPLTASIFVNVYGEDDNSIYGELGYPFTIAGTELDAFVGVGEGTYYTSDGDLDLVNVGLSASKDIKITDSFSLGVSASAIFNPHTDDAYLVFILSL